jgi:signal transduction histidine kinase
MRLRTRLGLATVAAALPLVLALVWWDAQAQQRAAESALIEFTRAHVERPSWRARCESAPETWSADGAPDGPRGPPAERGPPPEREPPPLDRGAVPPGAPAGRPPPPGASGPRHRRAAQFFAYDAELRSHNPEAPMLSEAVRQGARGKDVTVLPAPWQSATVQVLLHVGDGPCAYLLASGTTEPWLGAILPPTRIWLTPLAVMFGAVLLALGPVIARIRRLTAAVKRSAMSHYVERVDATGNDEIAELARAFDGAARDVRAELVEKDRRERALREFLANTTHDVMIPLTVLQGHLAGARDALAAGGAIEPATLAAAMDEAHYLGALLGNLALAAKLDSNAPELQRGKVDLNALVTRVIARHRPIARELSIELEAALPERVLEVDADVTMLEQAVSNIVYNAVRHNQRGGHVAVILDSLGTERFRLRVLDDGPGIAPDELARLVERGFRGNAARTRAPNGQGLGLDITRRVAELHGLTLSFERSEFEGLQVDLVGECSA